MDLIGLENWRTWQRQGCTRVPVVRRISGLPRPTSWQAFAQETPMVLLESAQAGRFTYLCDKPRHLIVGSSHSAEIWDSSAKRLRVVEGKPLDVLRSLLAEIKAPAIADAPAMMGGLIGVLGYDVVRTWEQLPMIAARSESLPLYALIETEELFVYDERERELHIVVWSQVAPDDSALSQKFAEAVHILDRANERWRSFGSFDSTPRRKQETGHPVSAAPEVDLSASFTPAAFADAARRVLDYIAAGDTYQVNLSLRTARRTSVAPELIYEALRTINPSPYMGLLRLPGFALVCGSPELLVKLENGVVSSRPIAGTRPRGSFETQDSNFSAELFANEKERAEHLMLVDLIRNDIGRVAEFGTVEVKEFMVLERYSHVMHIVSQVEGRLASGQTWIEVFKSMFPGGTITGCPKIRTMEIIEELEPVGRDFYTGALGWISYRGEMEMNIVIRSMLIHHGLAQVQSGAGIVADSQPDRELDETLRKAQALWVALEKANHDHGRAR